MTTQRIALPIIKQFEGCKLKAYKCPAGIWTIAYGHTLNVKAGDTCTQAQADAWLAAEYDAFESGVMRLVANHPTTANQLAALVSFSYNLGLHALAGSTLLKKHIGGYYAAASLEFGKWNKAGGVVLNGLTKRRAAEAELYRAK